jgi:hypothetical protein
MGEKRQPDWRSVADGEVAMRGNKKTHLSGPSCGGRNLEEKPRLKRENRKAEGLVLFKFFRLGVFLVLCLTGFYQKAE